MLYRYALTIPAGTAQDDPVADTVGLTYGVLRNVDVSFPPGCAGLVHVAVRYHEHQIIPLSPRTWLAWDDYTVTWPEEIPIFWDPYTFDLVGWSEDDSFDHEVVFRFDVLPPRSHQAGDLVQRLLGSLPALGGL